MSHFCQNAGSTCRGGFHVSSIHLLGNASRYPAVCLLIALSGASPLLSAQSSQQSTAAATQKAPTDKNAGKPKVDTADARAAATDTLEKLNGALESLAARVSPAVVQI